MIDVVLVIGIAIVIGAVGLGIGMLVAGRITAWMDRSDKEQDER